MTLLNISPALSRALEHKQGKYHNESDHPRNDHSPRKEDPRRKIVSRVNFCFDFKSPALSSYWLFRYKKHILNEPEIESRDDLLCQLNSF